MMHPYIRIPISLTTNPGNHIYRVPKNREKKEKKKKKGRKKKVKNPKNSRYTHTKLKLCTRGYEILNYFHFVGLISLRSPRAIFLTLHPAEGAFRTRARIRLGD